LPVDLLQPSPAIPDHIYRTAAVLTGATLIAGCRGGAEPAKPPDIATDAAKVGCASPTPEQTEEIFIREAVRCADGRRLITFGGNDARDNFRKAAQDFGGVYEEGNGYLVEEP
jgi:hypothetical protein